MGEEVWEQYALQLEGLLCGEGCQRGYGSMLMCQVEPVVKMVR